MWTVDKDEFPKLEAACGSRYLAILFVAASARDLARKTPGWVIESKLISWVITGESPDFSQSYETYYSINPEVRELNDFLCYVEDREVAKATKRMYFESIKNRHLVYAHDSNLTEDQQARSRVLLRMIWYQFQNKE